MKNEYRDEYGPPLVGAAQPGAAADDEPEYPVAILYLPDPGERGGLLTRWVKRRKSAPDTRKAGFRP